MTQIFGMSKIVGLKLSRLQLILREDFTSTRDDYAPITDWHNTNVLHLVLYSNSSSFLPKEPLLHLYKPKKVR